jgi:hypothetical protein
MEVDLLKKYDSERRLVGLRRLTGGEHLTEIAAVLDSLVQKLVSMGPASAVEQRVSAFREAVEKLNEVNARAAGEAVLTDEREEICPVLDEIAGLCGIHPYDDGYDGEWIDEWRDW